MRSISPRLAKASGMVLGTTRAVVCLPPLAKSPLDSPEALKTWHGRPAAFTANIAHSGRLRPEHVTGTSCSRGGAATSLALALNGPCVCRVCVEGPFTIEATSRATACRRSAPNAAPKLTRQPSSPHRTCSATSVAFESPCPGRGRPMWRRNTGRTGSVCGSKRTGRPAPRVGQRLDHRQAREHLPLGEIFEANVGDVEDDSLPTPETARKAHSVHMLRDARR